MDWEAGELLRIDLRRALAGVGMREQEILVAMFGLDGQPACIERELAGVYGLSQARVHQIKKRGLRRMRQTMVAWAE